MMMRVRWHIAAGQFDAAAVQEFAIVLDGDEHRRVAALGDADDSGRPLLPSHRFLSRSDN